MRDELLLATLLIACLASPAVAAPDPPYNIIVIKTDDQRWDTVTRVIDGRPVMPKVTALLAGQGITFTEAFVGVTSRVLTGFRADSLSRSTRMAPPRPNVAGLRKVWIAVQDSQVVLLTGKPQEHIVPVRLRVEAAP